MTSPPAKRLAEACAALARSDPALARAHDEVGLPTWRVIDPGYGGLARIIAFQQISTQAATAIWGRVCDRLGEITPEAVLAAEEDMLRGCGLSRPKVAHLRSIAAAVTGGELALDTLSARPIEEARASLTAVKGIGPWTADVFLLTATGAMDAFPAGDVGLMESYRLLRGDEAKFPPADFLEQAETWRPFRGVAAHLLWDWINRQRGRDNAPALQG